MGLHELYKCEHCPEFHTIELDLFLKVFFQVCVGQCAQRETDVKTEKKYLCNTLLYDILNSDSPNEVRRYFQLLDRNIENVKALGTACGLIEDNINEFALCKKEVNSAYQVVKCIKAGQRVCVRKLKVLLGGQPVHYLYRVAELFSSEPSQQWMEVFKFNIHVKPLWFTRNRVYQFPTRIVAAQSEIEGVTRYDCKIKVAGEFKLVLTFDLESNNKWIKNPNSLTEDVMSWALDWQTAPTDFTRFTDASTGKQRVPSYAPNLSRFYQNYVSASIPTVSSHDHGYGVPLSRTSSSQRLCLSIWHRFIQVKLKPKS